MNDDDPAKIAIDGPSVDVLLRVTREANIPSILDKIESAGGHVEPLRPGSRTFGGQVPIGTLSEIVLYDGVLTARETMDYSLPPMDDNIPQ